MTLRLHYPFLFMTSRLSHPFLYMIFLFPFLFHQNLFAKATPITKAPGENEPLEMENADHFEGYRSRGEYVLSGKVRFRHGALRLETEKAIWLKDRNIVNCESGMRIVHQGAVLTAERGSYDKNRGEATAEGKVFMRDSSGNVEAQGKTIVYLRYQHSATLSGNPELRRFYTQSDSSAKAKGNLKDTSNAKVTGNSKDTGTSKVTIPTKSTPPKGSAPMAIAPKSSPFTSASTPSTPKKMTERDTLFIRGEVMTYNDSTQIAIADGKVRITRDKMNITCHKAEYHDKADSLFLLGDPVLVVDDNQIKGISMRLGMHGEEIRSLLVKGDAQAHSREPATDTSVARESDVKGDSLFMVFKEKTIDSVQVFKHATGTYYDIDKPKFVNKMSGDYMVLRFSKKQVQSANVLGDARSTYYHFEKKALKGRNQADGDTIDFAFKEGKIEEVRVKGHAKGTYYGERAGKAKKDSVMTKITGGKK